MVRHLVTGSRTAGYNDGTTEEWVEVFLFITKPREMDDEKRAEGDCCGEKMVVRSIRLQSETESSTALHFLACLEPTYLRGCSKQEKATH
jgi:hypothetical protein